MIISRLIVCLCLFAVVIGCGKAPVDKKTDLETLSVYAGRGSDMLISLRPKDIVESALFELAAQDQPKDYWQQLGVDPADLSRIAVMLPTPDTNSVAAMGGLAKQIQVAKMQGISAVASNRSFEQLNPFEGVAALVQFERAKSLEEVKTLIEGVAGYAAQQADFDGLPQIDYRVVQLRDKRFLCANDDSFPAILEMDDRTFVVCQLDQMREGFEREFKSSRLLKSLTKADRDADFLVACQANELVARSSPLRSVGNPRRFAVAFDLTGPRLASSRIHFTSPSEAEMSAKAMKQLYAVGKRMLKQKGSLFASESMAEWQMAKQFIDIYESVTISAKGATLSISVPRPRNFESLVSRMAEFERSRTKPVSKKNWSPFN